MVIGFAITTVVCLLMALAVRDFRELFGIFALLFGMLTLLVALFT